MDITNQKIKDKSGFRIEWIEKDFNQEGDDYDPDNVEYKNRVYSDLQEARVNLLGRMERSPVSWGAINEVEYQNKYGFPYGWVETTDSPLESY